MTVRLDIIGDKVLLAKLATIGGVSLKRKLKRVHSQVANDALRVAKANINSRTGHLRNSTVTAELPGDEGYSIVSAPTRGPYAPPIHWGWNAHNITANPYIQNALKSTRSKRAATYELKFAEIVKKAGL